MTISNDENIDLNHIHRAASERGRRKASRGDRRQTQLLIHQQQNIDEVNNIGEWMKSNGWEKNVAANHWTTDIADALSVPEGAFSIREEQSR